MKLWPALSFTLLFFFLDSAKSFAQVATVVRASGQVEILTESGAGDAAASTVLFDGKRYKSDKGKPGLRVKDGVIIKTGNESKATLIYQNGDMLTIGADTFHQVLAVKTTDGKPVMNLLYGKVRAQIAKDGPRSGMEVQTRTSVMGVRGTDFYVKRPGDTADSELVVLRGEVAVSPKNSTAVPQSVKAGNTASVDSGSAPVVVAPAEKATLITVQKETATVPAGGAMAPLEAKAAANIRKDIKQSNPKLFAKIEAGGVDASNTFALNTMAVESVYEAAPAPKADAPAVAEEAKVVFVTTLPPEEPELTEPAVDASLSTGTAERRVDFAWKAAARAVKYEWQASSSERFSDDVKTQSLEGLAYSTSLPPLSFYWRVRGLDTEGRAGAWSASRRFSIGRVMSPEEKAALAAENGKDPEPKEAPEPAPEPETKPEVEPTPEPAPEPTVSSPANLVVSLGLGSGNYTYQADVEQAQAKHSGGGSLLAAAIAYRWSPAIELQASVGQRSYEGADSGDDVSVPLLDVGGRYFYGLTTSLDVGGGLTYAREGLPHPSATDDGLKTGTLEQVYLAATVAPRAWPVMGWRGEVAYGLIGGSSDFDVRKDKALYVLAGYERQWFSFPITLGLNVKRTEHELTLREKNGLDGVKIHLERTDISFKAGYAF